jgi:hypothetical protein
MEITCLLICSSPVLFLVDDRFCNSASILEDVPLSRLPSPYCSVTYRSGLSPEQIGQFRWFDPFLSPLLVRQSLQIKWKHGSTPPEVVGLSKSDSRTCLWQDSQVCIARSSLGADSADFKAPISHFWIGFGSSADELQICRNRKMVWNREA